MENETPNSPASSSSRPGNPQGSLYSGIPDRQTVQVIQQALSRQPSTAAQYLQQMYAAQQQHLMLQTAALQQQSLTAAQQANLAASRAPPGSVASQQSPSPTMVQRPQTISAPSSTSSAVAPQAVLLGNAASPALSTNQAQMYLRAQMLIFTPTSTVSSVPPEVSPGATTQSPTISTQVQNLAVRGGSIGQSQLHSLKTATATANPHPLTNREISENHRKAEYQGPASKTLIPVTVHPIIAPVCSPQLIHPQRSLQIQPRPALTLSHPCVTSPPITSQAALAPPFTCAETNGHRHSPATQVPQQCPGLPGQEVTAQRRLLPASSTVILQSPAAPGATPPAAEIPYKRCSSISPLVKGQPPVRVAAVSSTQTAVSMTRASDHYRAHGESRS
ncbi:polyhomeotic-like protein 2 [Rhinoderma darwinii]|uniref:polyhomeotic-like protein 2 n=1 Tax=Rhinoderma darwinii TaxID=43563 RepID=UPI003F673D32